MIYSYELLSAVKVQHLNNFYDFAELNDGSRTGSDNKDLKNNLEIGIEHTRKMWDLMSEDWNSNKIVGWCLSPVRISMPIFVKYVEGSHYDWHCDHAIMGEYNNQFKTHMSTTIFLNDPDEYEGGVLEIMNGSELMEFKLPAGHAVSYPTGTRHRVTKVTSGERKVGVLWSESYFPDMQDRQAFARLSMAAAEVKKLFPTEDREPGGRAWNLVQMLDEQQMYFYRTKAVI